MIPKQHLHNYLFRINYCKISYFYSLLDGYNFYLPAFIHFVNLILHLLIRLLSLLYPPQSLMNQLTLPTLSPWLSFRSDLIQSHEQNQTIDFFFCELKENLSWISSVWLPSTSWDIWRWENEFYLPIKFYFSLNQPANSCLHSSSLSHGTQKK